MLSKVDLELKERSDNRRSSVEAKVPRKGKIELELKKAPRDKDVNLMFADSWNGYAGGDVSPAVRGNKESKELLVYCGKRSGGSTGSSESSNSSHYDEHERAESTLSDLLIGSDNPIYEVDGESDVDSPPHDPSHGPANSPSYTALSCSSPNQYRYCWYCYETYKAMCMAQGKPPPSIFSHGLWRGHCMRDANRVTTCPHLWFTTCSHCGATGSAAHSPQFCPMLEIASLCLRNN
ncbi:hypothetical protein RB195_005902 [Necator americanus]|uniref:Nanos-type domain-containing protein n=1 Tax=Necator americanus TaxID=51031 RepID=A0ABR1BT67_NECAM